MFELIRGVYLDHMPHQEWRAKIESSLSAVSLNPRDVLGKYPHQSLLAAVPELHKKWAAPPDHGMAEPAAALRAVGPEPPPLAEYEPGHLVAGAEL